jgi:hypothetical protein
MGGRSLTRGREGAWLDHAGVAQSHTHGLVTHGGRRPRGMKLCAWGRLMLD